MGHGEWSKEEDTVLKSFEIILSYTVAAHVDVSLRKWKLNTTYVTGMMTLPAANNYRIKTTERTRRLISVLCLPKNLKRSTIPFRVTTWQWQGSTYIRTVLAKAPISYKCQSLLLKIYRKPNVCNSHPETVSCLASRLQL